MIKGFILNNTGRSRHIFQKTMYPGQRVALDYVYNLLKDKPQEGQEFLAWLKKKLPVGWELHVEEFDPNVEHIDGEIVESTSPVITTAKMQKESGQEDEDAAPSLEYATIKALNKLTAKQIYGLRLKDNPQKVIFQIDSVHKLRRALQMCMNDSRKAVLTRVIRKRIQQLQDSY